MAEIIVKSYNELIENIEKIIEKEIITSPGDLRRYFFRGHANKNWSLIPNIMRQNTVIETDELKNLSEIMGNENSTISLAVAQHYGRKTRCLDFTRDYKIALYFACNPESDSYMSDGAIFILEKSYHKPTWFTNYLVHYVATNTNNDISSWEFSSYISKKEDIMQEFKRTGRSTRISDIDFEIQTNLGIGFMVDFDNYDFGFKRIKEQKTALYYFGSKYYYIDGDEKIYVDLDYLSRHWSSQNNFRIELHNLCDPNIETSEFCTKIIIPQRLKSEIFKKININSAKLGL